VGLQIRRQHLDSLVNGGRCPGGPPQFGASAGRVSVHAWKPHRPGPL